VTTPPDDTTEGLRERLFQVVLDAGREVDVNAIRAIVAVVSPVLERQQAELAGMRDLFEAANALVGTRTDERDEAQREVERLRAELAARIDVGRSEHEELKQLRAENDQLRDALAEQRHENANWRKITETYNEASENWRKRAQAAEAEGMALVKERNAAEAERDALKAAVERVRALHFPDGQSIRLSAEAGIPPTCPTCRCDYPCPTHRALDTPETPGDTTKGGKD